MAEKQLNLFETWPVVKKQRVDSTSSLYHYQEKSAEIIEIDEDSDIDEVDRLDEDGDDDDENEELCDGQGASVTQSTNIVCDKVCCVDEKKVYQPRDSKTLAVFTNIKRKFLPAWYDKYHWITLCLTKKKVLCVNCRFAQNHKLLMFSKKGDAAFITTGFGNYKKAIEKFEIHEKSDCHNEARVKIAFLKGPSISVQLNTQIAKLQSVRRSGLLFMLQGLRFLLRQGIAIRGHFEEEGNLRQLLLAW